MKKNARHPSNTREAVWLLHPIYSVFSREQIRTGAEPIRNDVVRIRTPAQTGISRYGVCAWNPGPRFKTLRLGL